MIRSFVISQFVSKIILFVGFSFNDPNLKFILREIRYELGTKMQHVYLLTDNNISSIENNHQFRQGVNILSLNSEDAKQELSRLKVNACTDIALSEKGQTLVNQLSVIRNYREHSDLMGMAVDFVKENFGELEQNQNTPLVSIVIVGMNTFTWRPCI